MYNTHIRAFASLITGQDSKEEEVEARVYLREHLPVLCQNVSLSCVPHTKPLPWTPFRNLTAVRISTTQFNQAEHS